MADEATVCLLALLAACGSSDNEATPSGSSGTTPSGFATLSPAASVSFPLTVKDDKGSEITLKASAKRIVALQPSFVEVLFAVGAGGSVVAADQNTNYPPEAANVPKISGFSPSVEC